jgi:hypothetical protein
MSFPFFWDMALRRWVIGTGRFETVLVSTSRTEISMNILHILFLG